MTLYEDVVMLTMVCDDTMMTCKFLNMYYEICDEYVNDDAIN